MLKRKARSYQRKACTYCKQTGHDALHCFDKRKPIRKESKKTHDARVNTTTEWYASNPPDAYGDWMCYLQISPMCPRRINRSQITLEHVYPKNKYKKLRYTILNIKPACAFCNKLKLSNTINKLRWYFPQLEEMIATSEWQEWEDQIEALATQLGIRLDRPLVEPQQGLDSMSS